MADARSVARSGDSRPEVVTGPKPLRKDVALLAAIFATSGTIHLVKPGVFLPLVPTFLPARNGIVLGSGVAELACAAGLLHPRTRSAAGWASVAVLLAVLPGNIQMTATAVDRAVSEGGAGRWAFVAGTVARLPLQWPLLRIARRAANG
jgi:uncharacterized membrane protein